MRITTANRRSNKDGAIKTGHNDRSFDISKADHIDQSLICKNLSWTWDKSKTQEESEQNGYVYFFGKGLEARNERYRKQRHAEKCRTIEDMRSDPKQCPEESIKQIGKHGQDIDVRVLTSIINEYLAWETKTFPNVKTLNLYIHLDEPNAQPHLHQRKIYLGHDKDGNLIPSQNKALTEMGIERPDPSKPQGRYNNAKITFDKMCREKFAELCKGKGLDIELEPQDPSKSGLTLLELKARTAKEEKEKAEQAQKAAEQAKREALKQVDLLESKQMLLEMEVEEQQQKVEEAKKEAEETIKKASSTIETERERQLQAQVLELKQEIRKKDSLIEELKTKLRRVQKFFDKFKDIKQLYADWKDGKTATQGQEQEQEQETEFERGE